MNEKGLLKAKQIITESNDIIVFTGAGISTESGIPDFRSPGGLWEKFDPAIYANYFHFLQHPEDYWKMEREVTKMISDVEPNAAHYAIAELAERDKLKAVITQNVDMLHGKAKTKAPIYELHGSAATASCQDCRSQIGRKRLLLKMEDEEILRCDECQGLIKPDVVLFGESLPMRTMNKAIAATQDADCFIVVGSSLLVSPANTFPRLAKEHGAQIIIINMEPTMFDSIADVCLCGKAGDILPKLIPTPQNLE